LIPLDNGLEETEGVDFGLGNFRVVTLAGILVELELVLVLAELDVNDPVVELEVETED
jgi:hypothetical protein